MEPIVGAIATGAARGLTVGAGQLLAKSLGKWFFRLRLCRAVVKRAKGEGFRIDRRHLARALADPSVQERLQSGDWQQLDSCATELGNLVVDPSSDREHVGLRLLGFVVAEGFRLVDEPTSRVESLRLQNLHSDRVAD